MTKSVPNRKAGAYAKARNIRNAYLLNPNQCLTCGNPILPKDDKQILTEVKKKRFCSSSCSAIYHNRTRITTHRPCKRCKELIPKEGQVRYCQSCREAIAIAATGVEPISLRTKGELFSSRKHWQSARNTIRINATQVYKLSGKPYICSVCGYDKHTPICHIKPVSEFPDNTLIGEINALENLIALCPNHHWELDHGVLNLGELLSVADH